MRILIKHVSQLNSRSLKTKKGVLPCTSKLKTEDQRVRVFEFSTLPLEMVDTHMYQKPRSQNYAKK
jgi:hypothetical protein